MSVLHNILNYSCIYIKALLDNNVIKILSPVLLPVIITEIFLIIDTKKKNRRNKRVELWDNLYYESNEIRLHIEELICNLKYNDIKILEDIFKEDDIKTKVIIMERKENFIIGLGLGFDIIVKYMPEKEYINYFDISTLSNHFKKPLYFFRSLGHRYKAFNKNLKQYGDYENKELLKSINRYYELKESSNLNDKDINEAIKILKNINEYLAIYTFIFKFFLLGKGKNL